MAVLGCPFKGHTTIATQGKFAYVHQGITTTELHTKRMQNTKLASNGHLEELCRHGAHGEMWMSGLLTSTIVLPPLSV